VKGDVMGWRSAMGAAVATIALCGCAAGPNYAPPTTPRAALDAFPSSDVADVASRGVVEQDWWTALNDPVLNGLIEDALAQNRDLAVAAANVEAIRARYRLSRREGYPHGDIGVDAQRRRESAATARGVNADRFDDTDFFNVSTDLAWEIDVFGRLRRGVEAARANAEEAEALREDVAALVVSETALSYIALREAEARLALTQRNAEAQGETLEATRSQVEARLRTELDLRLQETLYSDTLALLPVYEGDIREERAALATLTGRPPGGLDDVLSTPASVPTAPRSFDIGTPSDMLRRRPDVRASERRLAAATARIGVQASALFPRVTLVGGADYSGLYTEDGEGQPTLGFAYGPSISWSILDLARVKARIAAAEIEADGAYASYEGAVLTALQEVETALARYGLERKRLDELMRSETSSREAFDLARSLYDARIEDALTMLDAQRAMLAAEDRVVVSQAETARQYVAVYRALGGGWSAEDAPRRLRAAQR
jgi:NodT family efflux transporter outer membrane factor (OMF) lipoprotein